MLGSRPARALSSIAEKVVHHRDTEAQKRFRIARDSPVERIASAMAIYRILRRDWQGISWIRSRKRIRKMEYQARMLGKGLHRIRPQTYSAGRSVRLLCPPQRDSYDCGCGTAPAGALHKPCMAGFHPENCAAAAFIKAEPVEQTMSKDRSRSIVAITSCDPMGRVSCEDSRYFESTTPRWWTIRCRRWFNSQRSRSDKTLRSVRSSGNSARKTFLIGTKLPKSWN